MELGEQGVMDHDRTPPEQASAYHPVIPLHYQIQRVLRAQIESGRWALGERVPPEYDLMHRFEVSRTTIRAALRWLENDGLIVRHRRKGTFVAENIGAEPPGQAVKSLLLGYRAEIQVLGVDSTVPPADVAHLLGTEKDEAVGEYRRLEIVDDLPLAVVFNYVRADIANRINPDDLQRFSMLEILRDRLKLKLGPLRQSIWADLPDEAIAGLLKSDVSQPILSVRLLVEDAAGQAIQLCDAFYRGKTYRYETETFLPEDSSARLEGILDARPQTPSGNRVP
jgi:GntR family transcriptional regulator